MRTAISAALLPLLMCLFAVTAQAQTPPGIEWRHIETPHFEVVFPRGLEADANRSANALETFYGPMSDSFGVHPKRVTVRLENQTPSQNVGGYVNLAPFRSVWSTAQPQSTVGTNQWYTLLAAHEGRHLIQFRAMDRGFTHALKTLFGDAGLSALLGYSMPHWWLEGDAAVAESAYTSGGQARLASFNQLMRTNVLSGRRFSYMKAMHGSYNDVLPDAYELGAHIVSRVNRTSGTSAWNGIVRGWARQAWNPFALSRAMRQETGRGVADTYADMVSNLSELYQAKAGHIAYTSARVLNRTSRTVWTAYFHPAYESDGSVLVEKSGLADAPTALVRIHPDGTEETLFHYSPGYSTRITVANGRMVWDEYIPDPRWNRGYSEIVVHDLASGRRRHLTHRTRLEVPVLSPDGSRVAAIETNSAGDCSVAILDASTGAEVKRAATPDNELLRTPAWAPDNRRIALVRQDATGAKALAILDTASGAFTDLIAPSHQDIAWPEFAGEYVLYTSSLSGIANIYAVHTGTGKRYQVTSSRFGADFPHASPDGGKMLFSDYAVDGHNVAEMPLDPASWKPVETVESAGIGYHETNAHDYSASYGNAQFESQPFHPLQRLFNVHSWGITSPPPQVGFGVVSTDKMGLLTSTVGLKYDMNEGTIGYQAAATYRAFYPVLDFGFVRQNREVRYADYTSKWTERTAAAGFYIPLNLSRGTYTTSLRFGSGIESRRFGSGSLTPLNYWLWLGRFRYSAARDAGPAWGQIVSIGYRHSPWAGNYHGQLVTAMATLYVPSPVRHHSIRLEAGNERRHDSNYYFSSQMMFPRGYDSVASNTLWKASANYTMPLLYPDLALGQIVYLKRITGNLFFDYGRAGQRLYRSAGAEMLFDVHAFSMGQALRAGVRYSYRIDYHGARVGPFVDFTW